MTLLRQVRKGVEGGGRGVIKSNLYSNVQIVLLERNVLQVYGLRFITQNKKFSPGFEVNISIYYSSESFVMLEDTLTN